MVRAALCKKPLPRHDGGLDVPQPAWHHQNRALPQSQAGLRQSVALSRQFRVSRSLRNLPPRCPCSTCSASQRLRRLAATPRLVSRYLCDHKLHRNLLRQYHRPNLRYDKIRRHPRNSQYGLDPVRYSDLCQCALHHRPRKNRKSLEAGNLHHYSRLSLSPSSMPPYKLAFSLQKCSCEHKARGDRRNCSDNG